MKIKELITKLLNYDMNLNIEDNFSLIEPLDNLIKNKITPGFRCDTCKIPSHAGQWGKSYPQPCFWCKGDYVYPGHKRAESCTDYDRMDTTCSDTRPILL